MSGLTPSLLAVTRRRAPGAIHFVRKVSTSEQSREREIDIIRRLRKQERIIKVTLEADINDFLQRLGLLYKPKSALDEAVQTALRQNKYISTERQMHAETMSGLGTEISDHFDEFKKHLKDFEEEPYPEWQPGDSDIFLRRLDDPRHKHEHLEADMNTKAKDVGRLLDKADKHHESLLKVRDVMREKGVKAAEALADKIVDSHSFDSAPIDAPLDPVDLDAIDEDTPTIRNSMEPQGRQHTEFDRPRFPRRFTVNIYEVIQHIAEGLGANTHENYTNQLAGRIDREICHKLYRDQIRIFHQVAYVERVWMLRRVLQIFYEIFP
ncbi:hypothetical protein E4T42_06469 [Aureobasidium subglaciale]|nr:hypothetical protein E4T42_06469 [Aureobasidium subglaciale]